MTLPCKKDFFQRHATPQGEKGKKFGIGASREEKNEEEKPFCGTGVVQCMFFLYLLRRL